MWRPTLALTLLVLVSMCIAGLDAKKGKKPGKAHAPQICETDEDCLGPSVCEGRPERAAGRNGRRNGRRNQDDDQQQVEDTPDATKFCKSPSCELDVECDFHEQYGFNGTCVGHMRRSRCLYPVDVRKFYVACKVAVEGTSALERDIDCPAELTCGPGEETVAYNGVNYTISQCQVAEAEEGGRRRGGKGGRGGRGRGRGGRGGHRGGHRKGEDSDTGNAIDAAVEEEGEAQGPARRRGGRRKGGRPSEQ